MGGANSVDDLGVRNNRVTPTLEPSAGVIALRQGDHGAFEELFTAHAAAVHRFCTYRIGSAGESQDLLSIVFFEAWAKRAAAFEVEGSFRPWLLGIARNVCRSRFRSQRRHRVALARFTAVPDSQPDHAAEVAETVDNQRQARLLPSALRSLTAREREVVLLCLIEGLSHETAAQLLSMPLGTLKSTLARARSRMQRVLRTSEPSDPGRFSGHSTSERARPAPGEGMGPVWR